MAVTRPAARAASAIGPGVVHAYITTNARPCPTQLTIARRMGLEGTGRRTIATAVTGEPRPYAVMPHA